ncbi:hypothetical protein Aduo_010700 [Ancylostoma duodenale]
MRFSLLLLTAGFAFAAFQDEYPSLMPWISKFKLHASRSLHRAYMSAVMKKNFTIAEMHEASKRFFEENNKRVLELFEKSMKREKELADKYYEKVEKMLKKLLNYFESYKGIVNNKNQTFGQLKDAVIELRFTLNDDELEIADIIRYKFSPGAKTFVTAPSRRNSEQL